MTETTVEVVADAVLYEGYLLYPYRSSSVKNRTRWTFGGVFPRAYTEATGSEACETRTECLIRKGEEARLSGCVRFLHIIQRTAWQEATERRVELGDVALTELLAGPWRIEFAFAGSGPTAKTPPPPQPLSPEGRGEEEVPDLRSWRAVQGEIELSAHRLDARFLRLRVIVRNLTPLSGPGGISRDEAQLHAFASTHAILHLDRGQFVSLTDPADDVPRQWVDACGNVGTWPVLAGPDGATDTVLSSPIILPDYPKVAGQSPGDLFDATEIDEILTLRILTLTEAEKAEMATTDERVRALLERTESLAGEQLMQLHGSQMARGKEQS
jgi:hypothetical protein